MLPPVCFLLLLIIMKCHSYQNSWSSDYTPYKIPQDVMVDVVNNLALKLLAIHNEGNDNNIAISPYGALSVLVALLEGVRGSAMDEIRQSANIPSDLSVIRIGLRDIHRHLKSYFIPEEGFLSGLTLNHDNVTLNREYEDILRFYGFDIDSFNNALYPDVFSTEKTTSTAYMTDSTTESITSPTELLDSSSTVTTSTEETTETTVKMSTTDQTLVTTKTTKVPVSTTPMDLESTTNSEKDLGNRETSGSTITMASTTETSTTGGLTEQTSTTSETPTISTTEIPSSTHAVEMTTTSSTETEEVSKKEETSETATGRTTEQASSTSETTENPGSTHAVEMSTTITSEKEETSQTTEHASVTSETTTGLLTEPNTTVLDGSTTVENTNPTTVEESTTLTVTTEEFTSSINVASTVTSTVDTETSTTTEISTVSETTTTEGTTTVAEVNKREISTKDIVKYLDESKNFTLHNRTARSVVDYLIARYYDDHVVTQRPPPYTSEKDLYFLVNDKYKETDINYMTYDTVLPFHYISHLNTLALRFPLDSSKYYLLLLLPENHGQLSKLICELRLNTNLKYIIDNLQYTHVKAIIPSFMLKGYVILTSTIQKMGIRSVFEPRQADFSPMTLDRGIYVTNIEQAITVNIRNYVDPATMNNNNNRYLHRANPVLFKADHPFLYFVIDSEIDVVLMAGKIINPLNSRIR